MSILVVGDAMIDVHTRGEVNRISPEAPVPVIDAEMDSTYSLGAAANVAAQVAAAKIKCFFAYRAAHNDNTGSHDKLVQMLVKEGITPVPLTFLGASFPVITKERVWTGNQQLCRIDREYKGTPVGPLLDDWIDLLKSTIKANDIRVVIFSDYDKGTLYDYVIQHVVDYCKELEVITILDPKRFSYWGLQNLTLIKPNSREVAITNMNVKEVSENLGSTYLLNTLGKDGMRLWQDGRHIYSEDTYAAPDTVKDVCGCGDTVNAFLGIALYNDNNIEKAIKIASLAAAVNIKYQGCHVLTPFEIVQVLKGVILEES